MAELKSCPFCGWKSEHSPIRLQEQHSGNIWFHCAACGACSGSHKVEANAVEAWNHRAPQGPREGWILTTASEALGVEKQPSWNTVFRQDDGGNWWKLQLPPLPAPPQSDSP